MKIDHPTMNRFYKIFQKVSHSDQLEYNPKAFQYLMAKYKEYNIKINGCHPRDLIDHIIDEANYLGKHLEMTRQSIDTAWNNYFFHE